MLLCFPKTNLIDHSRYHRRRQHAGHADTIRQIRLAGRPGRGSGAAYVLYFELNPGRTGWLLRIFVQLVTS